MPLSRRQLLQRSGAVSLGFIGLRARIARVGDDPIKAEVFDPDVGFGPLVDDPNRVLNLPAGFSYHVFSKAGEKMDDGLFVPGLHDGMAAFPGPDGTTVLIRNHEVGAWPPRLGAFGWTHELLDTVDQTRVYDYGSGTHPGLGGTTTVVYDTRNHRVVKHFLSLAGTMVNCAGGATPWGTWISCEETEQRASGPLEVDHGYCFEVPANANSGLVHPVPLRGLGRFKHEAIAIDPRTGILYETEDQHEGLLYRFIPNEPGHLSTGGRLQALAIRGQNGADLRNWPVAEGQWHPPVVPIGLRLEVEWIDLDEIEAPDNDLRFRGHAEGAARFARGEGIHFAGDAVYICCTNGGLKRTGQVWKYTPSPAEGTAEETETPGVLELFVESHNSTMLENCDNITSAPWGDLMICEDSLGQDRIIGITPSGEPYELAANVLSDSELAGATFSPDGSMLFANIQAQGLTLGISGPWDTRKHPT